MVSFTRSGIPWTQTVGCIPPPLRLDSMLRGTESRRAASQLTRATEGDVRLSRRRVESTVTPIGVN
jgi:hypothetical protein